MSETVNQEINDSTGDGAEKTFTQAELDEVVEGRLKREREKYKDFDAFKEKAAKFDEIEANSKTELQKATDEAAKYKKEIEALKKAETVRTIRDEVAKETGVPANLLNGDTKEACEEQAKAILAFKAPGTYPNVQDGGEPQGDKKGTTAQQFADWMNNQL